MPNTTIQKEHWTVDKRIPIGTLFGLVLQAIIFSVWIGGLDKQVDVNTLSITDLKKTDQSRNLDMRVIEGRLSSLEATSRQQLKALERIERLLDKNYNGKRD